MPVFDLVCPNNHEQIDVFLKVGERPPCPTCGAPTSTLWKSKPSNVISDECDIWIRHGICNEDGSPRRYTSKAEMRAEAARRGLVNLVEHVTEPGTDKSPHTVRWISTPTYLTQEDEEKRRKEWWEDEKKLKESLGSTYIGPLNETKGPLPTK